MTRKRPNLIGKLRFRRQSPDLRDRYGWSKICAVDENGNWLPPVSRTLYRVLQLAELLGFLILLGLAYLSWSILHLPVLAWLFGILSFLLSPTLGSFWSYERYLENYMTEEEYRENVVYFKASLETDNRYDKGSAG